MKEFKIRCSAIGQIMTDPRSKSDLLSKSAMTYCENWLTEQIYGRRKTIQSKQMLKGILVEDAAIDLIAEMMDYGMLFKNEQYYENEFMTGTPDVILPGLTIDNKSPWDAFTFPLYEDELPEKDYYWQGIGYMHLTGAKQHKVCYTLMNTPDSLIEKEMRSYCFDNGMDMEELDRDEFRSRYTYDEVDKKYRLRTFSFNYSEDDVKRIENRVNQCREYIQKLISKL